VGVGDSLEARFTLRAPIAAGTWHLVGDGITFQPADIQFDVLWRRAGSADVVLATWQHHFDPPPTGFDAIAFEADAPGIAAAARAGDELVLRFTALGTRTDGRPVWIPNGDGRQAKGRIPSITLPPSAR